MTSSILSTALSTVWASCHPLPPPDPSYLSPPLHTHTRVFLSSCMTKIGGSAFHPCPPATVRLHRVRACPLSPPSSLSHSDGYNPHRPALPRTSPRPAGDRCPAAHRPARPACPTRTLRTAASTRFPHGRRRSWRRHGRQWRCHSSRSFRAFGGGKGGERRACHEGSPRHRRVGGSNSCAACGFPTDQVGGLAHSHCIWDRLPVPTVDLLVSFTRVLSNQVQPMLFFVGFFFVLSLAVSPSSRRCSAITLRAATQPTSASRGPCGPSGCSSTWARPPLPTPTSGASRRRQLPSGLPPRTRRPPVILAG